MNQPQNSLPILVYFNIRGKLQAIRYLLFYMNVQFTEIHLYDQQSRNIPEYITNILKKEKVQKSKLPILIHEDLVIYHIYPIMAYLCRRFGHPELLGRNIQQKAKLQEILEITIAKQCYVMMNIFNFSQKIEKLNEGDIMKQKGKFFEYLFKEYPYILQSCKYIENQGNAGKCFALNQITLVDFALLEIFTYMVGFFGDLTKECFFGRFCELLDMKGKKFPLNHLQTMKNFINFITSQPFYTDNKEYLEGFTILCQQFTEAKKKGLQKIWTLNKQLIK